MYYLNYHVACICNSSPVLSFFIMSHSAALLWEWVSLLRAFKVLCDREKPRTGLCNVASTNFTTSPWILLRRHRTFETKVILPPKDDRQTDLTGLDTCRSLQVFCHFLQFYDKAPNLTVFWENFLKWNKLNCWIKMEYFWEKLVP